MKYSILVTILVLLFSCRQDTGYITAEQRKLFKPYHPGDTIYFISSKNDIDTFLFIRCDSTRTSDKNLIGPERHQNHVNSFIRKLPRDTTNALSAEFMEKNRLDHREFLCVHKYPDEKQANYGIRFLDFEGFSQNQFGQALIDTITIMGRRFEKCYTFKNSLVKSARSRNTISDIYWTIDSGLVAYRAINGTEWVRTKR